MNFQELFLSVKKKISEHPEIILEREKLSVQISDVFDNAFYILWENGKCIVEPYHYNDYDVEIVVAQRDIEFLFTERQYLFLAYRDINVEGSFRDAMEFQRLLSYLTADNPFIVHEEMVSKILMKQDLMREDLGIIMSSIQLLVSGNVLKSVEKEIDEFAEQLTDKKKSAGKKTAVDQSAKKKTVKTGNNRKSTSSNVKKP